MKNKVIFLVFIYIFLFLLLFFGQKILFSPANLLASMISGFFPSNQDELIKYRDFSLELTNQLRDSENQIYLLNQEIDKLGKELEYIKKEELVKQEIELEKNINEEEDIFEIEEELIYCDKNFEDYSGVTKVIINEIAWMGTEISSNHEWIELKNVFGEDVDLAGWQLLNKDNKIKIIFDDIISTGELWLLERTSDESVLNISADLIYSGALKNSDEILYLFDENCQIQDKVIVDSQWLAGDNDSKRTMERKSDFNWQTSENIGGTPRAENSRGYLVIPPANNNSSSSSKNSYPEILISEIQILPINERFIELYNPNSMAVDLTNWYIQRKTETSTSWSSLVSSAKFEGKVIQPQSHFLIAKTIDADIILDLILTENNSLALKNPNQEIVDKVGWGNASDFETMPTENPVSEKSIGRKWDEEYQKYQDTNNNLDDFEIQTPTPKTKNGNLEINPNIMDLEVSLELNLEQEQLIIYQEEIINYLDVVINEIAWMGTEISFNHEWIELYNNTDKDINLSGWKLKAVDGTPFINLTGIILANSYYLLERTSDDSVPNIPADQIYTGALSNTGEHLQLYDKFENIIDEVDNFSGWFYGNNITKQTMERINALVDGNELTNWLDSLVSGGTPKNQNSVYQP